MCYDVFIRLYCYDRDMLLRTNCSDKNMVPTSSESQVLMHEKHFNFIIKSIQRTCSPIKFYLYTFLPGSIKCIPVS